MRAAAGAGRAGAWLGSVAVEPIEGKNGWLMRNALNDRLGAAHEAGARYRLDVRLDDQLEGLGLLSDDTITRERRTLRARYQLVDLESGEIGARCHRRVGCRVSTWSVPNMRRLPRKTPRWRI
jgi:LPS-assembly lipoprotein